MYNYTVIGDPLGPLLFCLSIHDLCSQLKSEFDVWYLDDSSVGGTLNNIRHDLEIVQWWGIRTGPASEPSDLEV